MSSGQPLAAGVSVGPGESFNREDRMIEYCICSGEDIDTGPWVGVQNEYMGYEFAIKGSVHFGWARLSVTEHGVATLYRLRLRDGSPQAHCDRKYGRRRRRRFSRSAETSCCVAAGFRTGQVGAGRGRKNGAPNLVEMRQAGCAPVRGVQCFSSSKSS
jgi:hypothetical protein